MPYIPRRSSKQDEHIIPTVAEALQGINVEDLKQLVALLPTDEKPTRKAELVALVASHLQGEKLMQLWARLDEMKQKAIAETIHSKENLFDADRFRAKYGQLPKRGAGEPVGIVGFGISYDYRKQFSLLNLFLYSDTVPLDLKERLLGFVPPPAKATLKVAGEAPETFDWKEYRLRRPREANNKRQSDSRHTTRNGARRAARLASCAATR